MTIFSDNPVTNSNQGQITGSSSTTASFTAPANSGWIVFFASMGPNNGSAAPAITSMSDTLGSVYTKQGTVDSSTTSARPPNTNLIHMEMWSASTAAGGSNSITVNLTLSCNPGFNNGPWAGFFACVANTLSGDPTVPFSFGSGTVWTVGPNLYDTVPIAADSNGFIYGFAYTGAGVNLNSPPGSAAYDPGDGASAIGVRFSTSNDNVGSIVGDIAGAYGAVGSQAGWFWNVGTASLSAIAIAGTLESPAPSSAPKMLLMTGVGL